jgi:subtilisin family serine protease
MLDVNASVLKGYNNLSSTTDAGSLPGVNSASGTLAADFDIFPTSKPSPESALSSGFDAEMAASILSQSQSATWDKSQFLAIVGREQDLFLLQQQGTLALGYMDSGDRTTGTLGNEASAQMEEDWVTGINQDDALVGNLTPSDVGSNTSANTISTSNQTDDTLATARNLGTLVGSRSFTDSVGGTDPLDLYRFDLDVSSNLNLFLNGLSADADLYLIQDLNSNGIVETNEVLGSSVRVGTAAETISFNGLAAGTYFAFVYPYQGTTNYNLGLSASPIGGIQHIQGTLSSDNFVLASTSSYTVFSGNGNVNFGQGQFDQLVLSNVAFNTVSLNLASAAGGGVVYDPGNGVRVFDGLTLSNGSQILFEGLDRIVFADYTLNLAVTPNDPLFSQQWNLHMMGVQNAWRFNTGSSDVLIGVQDSGLGVNSSGAIHSDLRTTINIADNYADEFGGSNTSHGTAVQGIIAAASNNSLGMSGINWNSDVFQIDVIPGSAWETGDRDLVTATQAMIAEANQNGQRLVINMSLSGGIDEAFEQLVANNSNVLFVIASGNDDDGSLSFPAQLAATYSNVIAVGASWGTQDWYGNSTTPGDRISYANWWGSNYGDGLTLMGPSEVIATQAANSLSDVQFGFNSNAPGTTASIPFNGTSAATPNVTGVASLVWSANPNLTAAQVRSILSQTAYDLGFSGYDPIYGHGFINADAAVRSAIALA